MVISEILLIENEEKGEHQLGVFWNLLDVILKEFLNCVQYLKFILHNLYIFGKHDHQSRILHVAFLLFL
jgi:hypothetical protein